VTGDLSMLTPLGETLWVHDKIVWFGPVPLPHAMTVIRLSGGGLLVHSPTRLDDSTMTALSALGPVESILAPSWWHDMYLHDWVRAYPNAKLFGAPRLVRSNHSLPFQPPLDGSSSPWPEIDLLYIDRMRLFLDELVMLHKTSRSLVLADLAFHITERRSAYMKLCFRFVGAYPNCGVPLFFRLAPHDRGYLRQKIEQMLAWDFDTLVVGHGDAIPRNGKQALRQAYAWLPA
jgi:hypothetical protein